MERHSNLKFHENPSSGRSSSIRTDRRADGLMDRWTDMIKLAIAFRDFTREPKY